MMFDGGGAGPVDQAGTASASEDRQQQMPVPFSGGRKPTPRSVCIVSVQDSNAATAATGPGAGAGGAGAGGRREPGTDRTTTTRVSSSAGATPPPPPLTTSSFPFFFPSSSFFRSRVWSRNAKASAIGALSPTLFSFPQTPDARLRAAITAPPKFRSPGLHLELLRDPSWKTRIHFYLFPILVLAHIPLQTFLDFNASFILVQ